MSDETRRSRQRRGRQSQSLGLRAEAHATAALRAEGWTILGQRVRTVAGEIDVVAERDGLVAFIEVKSRPAFSEAVAALGPRQKARLMAAAALLLAQNPAWGPAGVRFDVILVDASGRARRVADAFRGE